MQAAREYGESRVLHFDIRLLSSILGAARSAVDQPQDTDR